MNPVRGTAAMIAGMRPQRAPGRYVFRSFADAAEAGALRDRALGSFHEAEGLSLILPLADDESESDGDGAADAMACITLQVHSALDGVGLTAAVADALAAAGIPCNMVAAFHHDHVFVPVADADRALAVLKARAAAERGGSSGDGIA